MVHYRGRQLPISDFQWDVESKHNVEDHGGDTREWALPGCCSLEEIWWRRQRLTSIKIGSREFLGDVERCVAERGIK